VTTVGGVAEGDAPDVRCASAADAAALSALALRSKAVWGYDATFMAACRAELTLTADGIGERPTWVLEEPGAMLGFCQLRIDGRMAEVAQFFIAPGSLRGGLGRRLWADLEARARRRLHPARGRFRSPRRRVLSRDGHDPGRRGALGQHPGPHAAASAQGALAPRLCGGADQANTLRLR
jgi:GNAT superfamily N-acetyltransferase